MAEIKTKPNDASVQAFLDSISDERRREESLVIVKLMSEVTKQPAVMYGTNIVGFGTHTYLNASGKEQEWFRLGFSPRKAQMTLYLTGGFDDLTEDLAPLGPHTTAKTCLYIKKLEAIDLKALRALLTKSNKLLG